MKISAKSVFIILIIVFITGCFFVWLAGYDQHPREKPEGKTNVSFRLVFVGDVMLSRNVGGIISRKSPEFPFEHVGNILRDADITMGNLESPISDQNDTECKKVKQILCFKA